MSDMNTANPRIPSPFDTAGMLAVVGPQCGAADRVGVSTLVAELAGWLAGYVADQATRDLTANCSLTPDRQPRYSAVFAHREAPSFHHMTVKLARQLKQRQQQRRQ